MRSRAPAALALWLALFVLVPACGGGGGGGGGGSSGGPNAVFVSQNDVHYFGLSVTSSSCWGTLEANGAGGITGGSLTHNNSASGIFGPYDPAPASYTIDTAGWMTLSGFSELAGQVTPDGSVALLGSSGSGELPAIAIVGRREGSFDVSSLSGAYHLCAIFHDGVEPSTWWGGTATFDGAGTVTLRTAVNLGGAISPPPSVGTPAPYTIATDGRVVLTAGALEMHGGIYRDGDLVVLTGPASAGLRGMIVMVPVGIGLSAATLAGDYQHVELSALDSSTGFYFSATGLGTSDGVNAITFGSRVVNFNGSVSTVDPLPGDPPLPYSVGLDGAFVIGAGGLMGGVSPSGRVAVVAGGTGSGTEPTLHVFLR